LRQAGQTLKEPIWERQDWESDKQWKAFSDYMRLPITTRDLKTLLGSYNKIVEAGAEYVPSFIPGREDDSILSQTYIPPTNSYGTILKWSSWGHWAERSQAYERDLAQRIAHVRVQEQDRRITEQINTDIDQVEEFRAQSLMAGKNTFSVGGHMLQLLGLTMARFPIKPVMPKPGEKFEDVRQPGPLNFKEIQELEILSRVYDRAQKGILSGQEQWALALGVKDAIEILANAVDESEAA
jgi:hypothetical protein